MYCERRGRAVAAQAHVHCGEHYDTLASCVVIAVAKLPASQTALEGLLLANQAVRARVVELWHMHFSADSFEEGAEGALAAQWLRQEVEGVLRTALVEVAPGLAAAARGDVGVRRSVLEAEGQRVQRGLAVRLRATSSSCEQRRDSR